MLNDTLFFLFLFMVNDPSPPPIDNIARSVAAIGWSTTSQ